MDNNSIKALVSLLDDDDPEILGHVEKEILSIGKPIIPFLEEEWEKNFNPKMQKRLEDLIHNLQFTVLKDRLLEWKSGEDPELLKGVWIVNTYLYPDYEFETLKKDLEQLFYSIWAEFRSDMHPFDQIKLLNQLFFGNLGFKANSKNFHSPSNSMMNMVLETRKGNPISLCVIYMYIAQRLGLPVHGVNLPNTFILTYKNNYIQFYVNVFNKGLVFSRLDIDSYISQLGLSAAPEYYDPCDSVTIIRRYMHNLAEAFERQGDSERVEEIKMLIAQLSL